MIQSELAFSDRVVEQELAVTEEWRSIPGSDGYYSVSDLGRVRSEPVRTSTVGRQRGRMIRCYCDSKGYLMFGLCLPGRKRVPTKVHRAVALAFLGPCPSGAQVNHISGDKTDNRPVNLEYVTCLENIHHAWRTGLRRADQLRGEKHGRAKLTEKQVREIRSAQGGSPATVLARRFGVTPQAILAVQNYETWRHVG